MAKALNTRNYIYIYNHIDILDIFRIILTLMILTTHVWYKYYVVNFGEDKSFGYIAVEAFFMISGFFVARSATQENAAPWYKYLLKKIKKFMPLLAFVSGFGLILFTISSSICFAPNFECFTSVLMIAWYLYYLIIFGPLIYFFIKRWKEEAMIIGLFISFCIYIGLYFWVGCIGPVKFSDNGLANGACIAVSEALRGIAALLLGCGLFFLAIKLQKVKMPILLRILWSIIGMVALGAALYLTVKFSHTPFEFLIVLLFLVILSIIFCNFGLLTKIIKLKPQVSTFISKLLLTTYLFHGSIVAFMYTFSWYNESLWQTQWWLITHGLVCYVGSPILSAGINKLYDLLIAKIKQKK